MELIIDRKIISRGTRGNYTGVIYFEVEGINFPEKNWNDFLLIIVNWWMREFLQSDSNGNIEFCFMDGPYSILFKYCKDDLYQIILKGDSVVELGYKISKKEIGDFLRKAGEEIIVEVESRFGDEDVKELKKLHELL